MIAQDTMHLHQGLRKREAWQNWKCCSTYRISCPQRTFSCQLITPFRSLGDYGKSFHVGQDLAHGFYSRTFTVQIPVKSGCSFPSLPPENTFVLPLLKARQKILEWCSPFSWTGLTLEWMASSICQSKTRRSSPPRRKKGNVHYCLSHVQTHDRQVIQLCGNS